MRDKLAEMERVKADKKVTPTVGIMDSQSVKTTSVGGEFRGYDAGKKTKGRKRHVVVDTLGLIVCITVHSCNIQGRDGSILVMNHLKENLLTLVKIFADGGYAGKLVEYVAQTYT